MAASKTLDEAIEDILNALETIIQTEVDKEEGSKLSTVNSVIREDRVRPMPDPPIIVIHTEMAQNDHTSTSIAETWTLPVAIESIYETDEPVTGYREASRIAANTRSVILKNRTLGLRELVQDTKSKSYIRSNPTLNSGQLYSSIVIVEVIFTIIEP